ncbi:DNA-binding protein [Paenibacillus larvae]|uniref:DNA-binding protein n=1 Tax=Paenibacillus larvae TaxID=1464 RepID=UPI00228159A5|nr:DNA-binding protein [Paenibacillus larvae]MCY9677730.1 DNA-binding protein [Paenibacillus larvae]
MDSRIALRVEIENAIVKSGYTLSSLSEYGGLSIGNLSASLQKKKLRPITLKQLDTLTEALGLPEGYYYEHYLAEVFAHNNKVSIPRMKSFLIRCAELGRTDLIMNAIHILVEHPKYTELLFSVAEELYLNGLVKESVFFYEEVIEGEKYNHSDRLAISHYRIFRATIGSNAEENYKAVIRFEDFRKNLPENFQLDALLKLSKVCLSLKKWNLTEQFADELRILSTIRYQEELLLMKEGKTEPLITERPLVVYYGQSYLIKSIALFKQGHYEKAKQYIEGYEDLSWFEILDEQGKKEVESFVCGQKRINIV